MKRISLKWGMGLGLVLLCTTGHAQLLRNLERKIENKVNQRLERKVDQQIEKKLDQVEEKATTATSGNDSNSSRINELIGGQASHVEIKETYVFDFSVIYAMSEKKNNKTKALDQMVMWYSSKNGLGMSNEKAKSMFMVFEQGTMIAFLEDQKRYYAMGQQVVEELTDLSDADADTFTMTQEGKVQILGYNCEVYRIKSDEGVTRIWVTPDLNAGNGHFMQAFGQIAKIKSNGSAVSKAIINSTLLKLETTAKDSDKTLVMEAIKVNRTSREFSTRGYQKLY